MSSVIKPQMSSPCLKGQFPARGHLVGCQTKRCECGEGTCREDEMGDGGGRGVIESKGDGVQNKICVFIYIAHIYVCIEKRTSY